MLSSPFLDLAPPSRPTGAQTASRLFALELAATLSRGELNRFDRPLQNIELVAEHLVRSRTNAEHPRCWPGASGMDGVAPGEVLIVYADGRRRGGVGLATPSLETLAASVTPARAMTAAERRRALIGTAIALRPRNRPEITGEPTDDLLAIARDIVVIAGLLLDDHEFDLLRSIRGAVPALAIAALTDSRGRPTVETRHIATRFPGRWLGTRAPEGTA